MYKKLVSTPNGVVEVEMTPDEITARQAEEALPGAPLPLKERLKAILFSLSDEVQAAFIELSSGVDEALDNDKVNVAKIAIENAAIPAELEPVRQLMLQEFPNG